MADETGVEIVMHPMDGEYDGDAFAIRYRIGGGPQKVVVIDSGRSESDARSVKETVTQKFGSKVIDLLIVTHSDDDHAGGARKLIDLEDDDFKILEVWVNSSENTDPSSLTASAGTVKRLVEILSEKSIASRSAVAGTSSEDGCIILLGPSQELFAKYRERIGFVDSTEDRIGHVTAALSQVQETWEEDSLVATNSTTTEANRVSVITVLKVGSFQALFTGDAGTEAIEDAASLLSEHHDPSKATIIQVPHHGSINNTNTASADRLAGGIVPKDTSPRKFAMVSGRLSKVSRRVTNSFIRRGWKVYPADLKMTCSTGCFKDSGGNPVTSIPFEHNP